MTGICITRGLFLCRPRRFYAGVRPDLEGIPRRVARSRQLERTKEDDDRKITDRKIFLSVIFLSNLDCGRRPRWAIGEICGSLVWVVVCGFAPLREIRSAATLNITRKN